MHKKQLCLDVGWSIWIQATSDPDSRMSYYRDAHTPTDTHTVSLNDCLSTATIHQLRNKKFSVSETRDRGWHKVKDTNEWTGGGNWRPWWLGCRAWAYRLIESPVNLRMNSVVKKIIKSALQVPDWHCREERLQLDRICWEQPQHSNEDLRMEKRKGRQELRWEEWKSCSSSTLSQTSLGTQACKNVK